MTLSQHVKRTTATNTSVRHRTATQSGVRHRTAPPRRRTFHRRTVAPAPPATQTGPITVGTDPATAIILRVDRMQLAELRDWGILVGASLAGWIATAIAFGVV
jgi:hypothetical protein